MATPGAGSSDGSSSQFEQLLSVIQKVEANVDAKLTHMKRELMDERESADERLVKKLCLDTKPHQAYLPEEEPCETVHVQ